MRFPEAMYYALKIRKKNPHYVLCGSVALIMSGKLPVRDVHDIDFVTNERFISEKELNRLTYGEYGPTENDGYTCYEVLNYGVHGVWGYNLFVFPDDVDLKIKEINITVNIQHPDEILKWKKKYNREKDIEDIEQVKIFQTKY